MYICIELKTKILIFILFLNKIVLCQVYNDRCDNASEIIVSNDGYGLGLINSKKVDLKNSTKEIGEQCAEEIVKIGNCFKTVWYKFKIPTTRNVQVSLRQKDSLIPQIFVGFTIYKTNNCNYSTNEISNQLTPLSKFGSSGNNCLQAGTYYIQVSSKFNVKDSIWIELDISKSNNISYDFKETPEIINVYNNTISFNANLECLSIDSIEKKGIIGSNFTKSFWIKSDFYYNSSSDEIKIFTNSSFAYRIFTEMPNIDSFNFLKPFVYIDKTYNNFNILSNDCITKTYKKVFIQIVLTNENNYFNIYVSSKNSNTDRWNTPNTDFIVNTNNTYNQDHRRLLNCNSLLEKHTCKNVIPDSFLDIRKYNYGGGNFFYDTTILKSAAYLIVNSNTNGILTINPNISNNNLYCKFVLFEGNINNTCNLRKILETNNNSSRLTFCVKPKTYTILLVYETTFPNKIVDINIKQVSIPIAKYYKHNDVENLGVFNPDINNMQLNSTQTYFYNVDTTIKIDSFRKKGKFIFSEFYLTKKANLNISRNYERYLFKGRFVDNTIKTLETFDYKIGYHKECYELNEGYYTILIFQDSSRMDTLVKCVNFASGNVVISNINYCTSNQINDNATKCIKINNNEDLLNNNSAYNGINYIYPIKVCYHCNSNINKIKPALKCTKKLIYGKKEYIAYYYSFYLGENAEVKFENSHGVVLYKGNIAANPNVINDSDNIIDPCNLGNIYCNLEGRKYYVMVQFVGVSETLNPINFGNLITVTKHIITPNDRAKNAYNFGHFNSSQTKTSTISKITCHTSSAQTDPSLLLNNVNLYNRTTYPLNFKDTQNKSRFLERRNIWYTFTVKGSNNSNINVVLNSLESCRNIIHVYRYKGTYNETFDGNFDSTLNSLEYITHNEFNNQSYCYYDNVNFKSQSCQNERYFVIVENQNAKNAEYKLSVQCIYGVASTSTGDFCSTPYRKQISQFGNSVISGKNNCNTWGGSPFENKIESELISTWFEIEITNINNFDIEISNASTIPIHSYNVYAGECGYLTKIAELKSSLSYFTLSCMTKGKIYIQAIAVKNNIGLLNFNIKIKRPQNINCKPYDFKKVVSQFFIKGGCKEDTLFSENISTEGDKIINKWYVNNQLISQLTNPIFNTSISPFFLGNNKIKLVVENTLFNTKDSSEIVYLKPNVPYYFKLKYPKKIFCYDSILVDIETNYPYKMNYEWNYENIADKDIYKNFQKLKNFYDLKISIKANSENCFFDDTITLNVNQKTTLFKDSFVCKLEKYFVKGSEYETLLINGVINKRKDFYIDQSGKYIFEGYYKGCYFNDTVNLGFYSKIDTIYQSDTLYNCNNTLLKIKSPRVLKNYLWNDNSTNSDIKINKTLNLYALKGAINNCLNFDYKAYIINETSPQKLLKDTSICLYDTFYFKSPIIKNYDVVYKSPNEEKWKVVKNEKLKIMIKSKQCTFIDSATVSPILYSNNFFDTIVCFNDLISTIELDGGNAKNYIWENNISNNRFYYADNYKIYNLYRTDINNCKDTIKFNVQENCPLSVFLPNAFTPNNDIFNNTYKFYIKGKYQSFNLTIFNRWGEVLFQTNTNKEWDGSFMGKLVQEGVYGVFLEVIADKKYTFRSTLTLLY